MNYGRIYFDVCIRPGSGVDRLLKSLIKFWPAIRIAGRIFGYGAYIYSACADDLRPTRTNRQQM
jgi:hypothetical protein